jgi:D-tyrosyl-tRNA(Tyr) deacylase
MEEERRRLEVGPRPLGPVEGAVRCVVQRVARASVSVDGRVVGAIGAGVCALVGVAEGDTREDAALVARKIATLRIFEGERDLLEVGGEALVVSQFTLLGDARKGRRPSWIAAARPEAAEPLVAAVSEELAALGARVAGGVFGAHMLVEIANDGPVTILLDSRKAF